MSRYLVYFIDYRKSNRNDSLSHQPLNYWTLMQEMVDTNSRCKNVWGVRKYEFSLKYHFLWGKFTMK